MLPQCSHMNRKRDVYCFRRRLPAPYAGEVAVSLQTHSFPQAMWLANGLRCCFAHALESGTDMHPDVARFLRTHRRDALAETKLQMQRGPLDRRNSTTKNFRSMRMPNRPWPCFRGNAIC